MTRRRLARLPVAGLPVSMPAQQWSAFFNGKEVPRYRAASYRECMVGVTGAPHPHASVFWWRMVQAGWRIAPVGAKDVVRGPRMAGWRSRLFSRV